MFLTSSKPAATKAGRSFDDIIALLDANGGQTGSGITVSAFSALQQSTVWACVRIVSEIIAQLPIEVHRKEGNRWVEAQDHDLLGLLAEPNDWQTQHDLISTLIAWSELEGNGYFFKIRNGAGAVRRLMPLESPSVDPKMQQDYSLRYDVASDIGIVGNFKADRIFHLRNFGSEGYKGLSTIGNHREGIGLALQLERHAVKAYKNGLQSSKWVEIESKLGDDEFKRFKSEIDKFKAGGTEAGGVPVLNKAKFHDFGVTSAVDAQYIESRGMQKEEIATIFLVPVFLLNSTANTTWGSGLEQISRAFIRFSLNPRLNRLGQTLVRELVSPRERPRTRIVFDTDQFTLGEFKERMDGYRAGIESGVLNPNECREIEGRNPREGGDNYRQPVNIATEGQANDLQNPKPTA